MFDAIRSRILAKPLSRVHIGFLIAVLLSLFFIPGLTSMSYGDRLRAYGQDFFHFPLFAAIAAALLAWWPRRGSHVTKAGIVTALAVGLAAVVELTQPYVGRTAAWDDLLLGAAGCVSVIAVYVGLRSASMVLKKCLGTVATVLFIVAMAPLVLIVADRARAARAFPLVDSFERRTEPGRWKSEGCSVSQVRAHATHGSQSLKLVVDGSGAKYPSIFLTDGPMDWQGYRRFAMDVFLEGEVSRSLWVRADDKPNPKYADRAQTVVELKPGRNTIWIDLGAFSLKPDSTLLDLSNIHTVVIFLDGPRAKDTIYIDRLILSKPGA
ncbi:MAG TPA: hypothetical protein VIH35_01815 [Kiritimatiellia bacterium]|jgi:hypothetical protein